MITVSSWAVTYCVSSAHPPATNEYDVSDLHRLAVSVWLCPASGAADDVRRQPDAGRRSLEEDEQPLGSRCPRSTRDVIGFAMIARRRI